MLTPTIIASQTAATNAPFENRRGREQAKRRSRGMSVQGPSERALLPGTRLSASLGGRGYRASERNNRAMTGQIDQLPPGGPTVWRRRRCWKLSEFTNSYRTRPNPARR